MKFQKGKPVPLTPTQKIDLGVRKSFAIIENGCSNWFNDLVVEPVSEGASDYGSTYSSSGTLTHHSRMLSTGDILSPKKAKFTISIRDHKDEMGLPDVVVLSFSMK